MHLILTSTFQILSGLFECIFSIKSKCITDNPGFICTLQSNFFLNPVSLYCALEDQYQNLICTSKRGHVFNYFHNTFSISTWRSTNCVCPFLYLIVSIKSISRNHDIWSLNQFFIAWILAIISKILKRLQTWKCFAD